MALSLTHSCTRIHFLVRCDRSGGGIKLLKEGGMVRKGERGKAMEDGMTPEIEATIRELSNAMVPDDAARRFLFDGVE